MKLTKLKITALKGATKEYDLLPINVLVGPMASGKTTLVDGIMLLLLGWHPALDKTARSIFTLCSGRELVVEGEFDNGAKIVRRWYLKGDSVKSEKILPPEFGEDSPIVTCMLDSQTYFALSERERVAYIFANIPMGGDEESAQGIFSRLNAVLSENEALKGDNIAAFVNGLLQASDAACAKAEADAMTPQLFLDFALEHATSEAKRAKDHAVTMEKTAQGLTAIRSADAKVPDLAALDAKKREIEQRLVELREEQAKHHGAAEVVRANQRRREELARQPNNKAAVEMLRQTQADKIVRLEIEIAQIPAVELGEIKVLTDERREADAAVATHAADIRAVFDSIKRNVLELGLLDAKEVCPYCGASGDGWKGIKSAEIESALSGLRSKLDTLQQHHAKVQAHAQNLTVKIGTASGHANRLQVQNQALAAAKLSLAEVEKELTRISAREEEIARIPANDPAPIAAYDFARSSVAVAESDLRSLDVERKATMGRAGDLKRLAEAETNRDAARADEVVAKAACDAIRDLKAKMVEKAFAPLLETANRLFGGVLKTPLAYHEGEIGTWREGAFVSHRTFSGGEKALTYASIQLALAGKSPIRLLVMDELGKLDDVSAQEVMAQIGVAINAGTVDQVVCIDAGRSEMYRKSDFSVNGENALQVLQIA